MIPSPGWPVPSPTPNQQLWQKLWPVEYGTLVHSIARAILARVLQPSYSVTAISLCL